MVRVCGVVGSAHTSLIIDYTFVSDNQTKSHLDQALDYRPISTKIGCKDGWSDVKNNQSWANSYE